MPTWKVYVELKGGEELVGLTRARKDPRSFVAATWYRQRVPGLDDLARHR